MLPTVQTAAEVRQLPLVPTRTIRFVTREGSWLSVDVSPDGRTIVFDLLGDLYTLPIAGGRATRITRGMAVDLQPRFSPDGKRIVFISDRSGCDNLWMVDPDGQHLRALTTGYERRARRFVNPAWWPNGRTVIVSKARGWGFELAVYDTAGNSPPDTLTLAQQTPLAPAPGGTLWLPYTASPTMGRDGHVLYAVQYVGAPGPTGMPQASMYQIVRIERATGARTFVTAEVGSAVQPLASPNGRYLVYATKHPDPGGVGPATALKLLDLQTQQTTWLVDHIAPSLQGSFVHWGVGLLPNMAFTPDSRSVILSYDGKLWRVDIPSGRRIAIPFTAEVEQELGPLNRYPQRVDDSVLVARIVRDVRASPDGSRLAFVALGKVWVMALPNGVPRRVTADAGDTPVSTEHSPAWSPDGQYLAFASWTEQGGHVYRVPTSALVDSASWPPPEQLTRERDYYDRLVYTPAGDTLILIRASWRIMGPAREGPHAMPTRNDDALELVAMPASGGSIRAITRVADTSRPYGWPHFSRRDSARVFFFVGDTLWGVRRDGLDRRAVLTAPPPPWLGARPDLLLSPTGEHVLIVGAATIELANVPVGTDSITLRRGRSSKDVAPLGGEFPSWAADGHSFNYSLGHSYFTQGFAEALDTLAAQHLVPHRLDITVRVAEDKRRGNLLLKNVRVITMQGRRVIDNADVLIRDNRIAALGAHGTVSAPPGTAHLDLRGKTILPGYVLTHEHVPVPADAHAPRVWGYLLALAYGVTTVHDPNTTSSADELAYADVLETGRLLGPRVIMTGAAVESQQLDTWDDARRLVERYSRFYDTRMLKVREVGPRLLRQWAAIAAHEERLTSAGHWSWDLVSRALDGYSGLEHASFIPLYDDVVQLFARAGIVYTPTTMIASNGPSPAGYFAERADFAKERKFWRFGSLQEFNHYILEPYNSYYPLGLTHDYAFPREAQSAARLVKAGGKVGVSTDGMLLGLGANWEIWALTMGGMSAQDALRSATLTGAEAIGMERELGSIEAGKLADLQVLDRNPLEDIHNTNSVRYVMKNGRLYDANTLDEVWPRRRPLFANGERPWWWEELPPNSR